MDNQIEMFPRDEFEQQTPHNDRDGIEEHAGRVPEPKNIDAISNSSEPHQVGQTLNSLSLTRRVQLSRTVRPPAPASRLSDRKTSPVFEATGLTGDFELSDHAFAFPDTSHEDIVALARDIEATGLLEEITLAWPRGTRRSTRGRRRKASSTRLQNGGRRANLPAPPPRDRSQALRLVQERERGGTSNPARKPWPSLFCFPRGVRVGPRLPRIIVGIPTISPVPPKGREQKLRASAATSSTWPTRWLTPTAGWLQKSGMPSMTAPFP